MRPAHLRCAELMRTPPDFIRNFEVPGRPVLLCGWMDDWPAMKKWDLDTLRRNYRTAKFKVGEKDNGDKIRLKMVWPYCEDTVILCGFAVIDFGA